MLFYLLSVLGLVPTFQKTKCKRLLNTTMERIKLLEKRREARHRQLQRDVIELLQRRKEHKIQPWLERIWKELCLFSVYIKIAEYCQYVQSNLKDIAGQRECPSGLEEPLAGLCFAASCCADLPELQELREIFALKYGKQFVNSAQELQPNCHVNQQFLECLCAKVPSETRKQALLEDITTQYNVKQGHEQDTQQQEIHDSLSIEGFVDAKECNQLQEDTDDTMKASEIKGRSESEELHELDAVQGSNDMESTVCEEDLGRSESEELHDLDAVQGSNDMDTVCEEDLGSMEIANRKRTLEDSATRCSAFKRTYRRRNGGQEHEKAADKAHECVDEHGCGALEGEDITTHMNEDVIPNEDQHILPDYAEQPSLSQPPQRPPPPPPPPKRVPPLLPSLRGVSMPSSHYAAKHKSSSSLFNHGKKLLSWNIWKPCPS